MVLNNRTTKSQALPDHFGFGGGTTTTIMHPAVMLSLLVTILLMLLLPRKFVVIPFLFSTFLIPRGQELYIAGMHWYVLRIVILAGYLSLAKAKFQIAGGLNGIDKAFIVWAIYRGVCPVLLLPQGGMVINQAAFWLEAFGAYFLLRHLVQNQEDIVRLAKMLAVIAVILSGFMLNERFNDVNVFGYLGGASITPQVRDGQIRAQATFGHPILAGSFGATLVPLFFWLWKGGKAKVLAAIGVLGSTLMVLTSASSTPVLAYTGGVLTLFLWPIRHAMRVVRWGIVLTLTSLAMVMKAPVWFIIAHVNVVGGSGGWDRAKLIDVFLRHLSDWWFIGTNQAGSWGFDMWDFSNQFVAEGETGGLVTFVCFIAIISLGFSRLGKMRKQVESDQQLEWFYWSLCGVMVAHILAYFGVSYYDQNRIWWWAFLAAVSASTVSVQNAPVAAEDPDVCYGVFSDSNRETQLWNTTSHPLDALSAGFNTANQSIVRDFE
jgi:hypothetical protein